MEYELYRKPEETQLCQGDILVRDRMLDNLVGHQDYFAESPVFERFMVITQTCDLVRDRGGYEFILLAGIRRLEEALKRRHVESAAAKNSTRALLRDMLNHNYNKRGFFYLPPHEGSGINSPSVVDLRVMLSLHHSHYDDLLMARCGAIQNVYAAQLGHMVGHMLGRVATPGWEQCQLKPEVERIIEAVFEREETTYRELATRSDSLACAIPGCHENHTTYRWLTILSEEGEREEAMYLLCSTHARQRDSGAL